MKQKQLKCLRCGKRLHTHDHTMGWVCQPCQAREEVREDYARWLVAVAVVSLILSILFARLLQ